MDPKTMRQFRETDQAQPQQQRDTIPMRSAGSIVDRTRTEVVSAIRRQPLVSIFVGLGAGLALGCAAGCLIAESSKPARSHDGISDKLASILPDALTEAFEKHLGRS